ncbi:MAG: MEKHLA domain-containing protein [Immundisolibacteraceae bacterium]|nr:MEKHLA domain-containing protein [Immundisolibacteraceae bacterium]
MAVRSGSPDHCRNRHQSADNRFQIRHATVWKLYHNDAYYGQAAMFSQWKML